MKGSARWTVETASLRVDIRTDPAPGSVTGWISDKSVDEAFSRPLEGLLK
jgi:hypothetical protein